MRKYNPKHLYLDSTIVQSQVIGKPEEVGELETMIYSQADILSWWHSDGCEHFVALRVELIII